MSTILDALRKAQTSTHEDNVDGPEPLARGATSSPPVSASFADDLPTFDELPGRIAPAKGPSALLAVAVAAGGLVLGVGAASLFTGAPLPFPFGGGDDRRDATIEQVATAPSPQPAADSKKSAPARDARSAGAVAQEEVDTRARRDRRRAAAGEDASSSSAAPSAQTGGAADVIAPVAPTAGDPAPAAPPPDAPGGEARDSAVAPAVPAQAAPEVLARLPEGVPDALRTPGAEGSVAPAPGAAPAPTPPMPAASAPTATGGTAPGMETAPPAAMPAPGVAPPATAAPTAPQPGVPGQVARAVPPAAPTLPGASPPAVAGSAPAPPPPGILEAAPAGAPEVSLLFIKWSGNVERRVASLRGPGGKLMLVREGDIIEGMRVGAIRPDAIELQWRGTSFLLLAAR